MSGTKAKGVRRTTVVLCAVLGCSLALLIWRKLQIVASVPRTAYADPSQAEAGKQRSRPVVSEPGSK